MNGHEIEIGGVYSSAFSDAPIRVIGLDDKELFYDTFMRHANAWGLTGNLSRRWSFSRTPLAPFAASAVTTDHLPLSEEERAVLRPDLPLRLGRNASASWHALRPGAIGEMLGNAAQSILPARKLLLQPYGKKGGRLKCVPIQSESESGFTLLEVFRLATEIQNTAHTHPSRGIGIYRLGFEKRTPSYYIGEYLDEHGYLALLDLE